MNAVQSSYLRSSINGPSVAHNILFVLKVLSVYYPEVMITSPSIGRQGKALRRRQRRAIPESSVNQEESTCSSFPQITSNTKGSGSHLKPKKIETGNKMIYFNFESCFKFPMIV